MKVKLNEFWLEFLKEFEIDGRYSNGVLSTDSAGFEKLKDLMMNRLKGGFKSKKLGDLSVYRYKFQKSSGFVEIQAGGEVFGLSFDAKGDKGRAGKLGSGAKAAVSAAKHVWGKFREVVTGTDRIAVPAAVYDEMVAAQKSGESYVIGFRGDTVSVSAGKSRRGDDYIKVTYNNSADFVEFEPLNESRVFLLESGEIYAG